MALNIPNVGQPGDAFLKGMEGGSNMLQKMMLSKYYGQLHPSGDVANALYIEQIGRREGYDSPAYLNAKAAHDLSLQNRSSMIDWRGTQQQLAPFRATTALGRSIAEGQGRGALDVAPRVPGGGSRNASSGSLGTGAPAMHRGQQWYDAEGNPVYPPDSYGQEDDGYDDEKAQAYEQDIAKKTTDSDARKRYLYATNIDKTRERIDPKDLLAYSGLEGTGRLLRDHSLAQRGKAPAQLLSHQKALTGAKTLAKQVRQFYGDSIQPEMEKKLTLLTNPATWYKTPDIAMAEFEAFNDILDAETETYRKGGTSPIHLRGGQKQKSVQQEAPNSSPGRLKYNPMTGRLE